MFVHLQYDDDHVIKLGGKAQQKALVIQLACIFHHGTGVVIEHVCQFGDEGVRLSFAARILDGVLYHVGS
jgi:hypothetical protein